ncbi:putative RNA-directed DNA polymerase from transposon X-element [Trichonephila clavipes]|nr:putative RNA-directed DNA polymerase from transposon X-element [Trichonephila clavipes]
MVQDGTLNDAVFNVTEAIRNAADAGIPKTSKSPRKLWKPWWNASCQQAKKEQRRAWGIFRRYPTTDNLIAFKRAKALARRIRRQCQRESWIQYVSSITSSTTSQQLWRKVKAANGLYRDFNVSILETSTALYSSTLDVANLIGQTFASVSSSDSYSPAFQATKNRLERTPINFRCRQPLPYNCDFDMFELKRALSSAHNTSPGPDGISYVLLRHLSEDSLVSLLYLFNRIWREHNSFFFFLDRAFASFLASCTVLESEGGGITDCDEEVGMIEEDDSRGVTIFLEGASVHVGIGG